MEQLDRIPEREEKKKFKGWKIDALKKVKAVLVFWPEGKNEK